MKVLDMEQGKENEQQVGHDHYQRAIKAKPKQRGDSSERMTGYLMIWIRLLREAELCDSDQDGKQCRWVQGPAQDSEQVNCAN